MTSIRSLTKIRSRSERRRPFPSTARSSPSSGLTARINFNSPVITQRDEYNLFFGARAALSRSFTLDAIYRGGWFYYTDQNRNDFNQMLGLSLRYAPRPWIAATASTSFGWNISSRSFFSYRVGNAGLNLGLVVKF